MTEAARIVITPSGTISGGRMIYPPCTPAELYRAMGGGYPKFFKMDGVCRLGFLGAELLLKDLPEAMKAGGAVILFNRSGSLNTDRRYQLTIGDPEAYFPSPALFVYTLANIVTGEIAIRHKIFGETSFYIMESRDDSMARAIIESTAGTTTPSFILTGWIEYESDSDYLADMALLLP